MPNLSLLNALGFTADGALQPGARFLEAFPQFLQIQNVPLSQVQLASGQVKLTFTQPVALAVAGGSLSIGAGAGGRIQILTSKQHLLDIDDPFQRISIGPDEVYIGLQLDLSAKAALGLRINPVGFGLAAEEDFTVATYRRFFPSDTGAFPTFGTALLACLRAFAVPQSRADLEALDRDTVIVVSGTGAFTLSSSVGISAPVHQLAATSVAGKTIQVNASANITAGGSVTVKGGYRSRLRRLENQELEIGIYKSRSRTLEVHLSLGAGLGATVGKYDLVEKLIGALSPNPVVDIQEFQQALPGENETARDLQIAAFQRNLSAAIATGFEARLTDSLSNLQLSESALTFSVALTAGSPDATVTALEAALRGDFTALTQPLASLPPGVSQLANVFTSTDVNKKKLNLNLLGILNFVSVGKLARIAEVQRNSNGDITLVTDTSDSNHLRAILLNAVGGSARKLQALLSEDFLFQATYKAVDLRILPPDFSAKHTFLEISDRTGASRMKDLLDVCRTMGIITAAQERARLKERDDFGRTSFWLQTVYANASVESTFFKADGAVRSAPDFKIVGRQALAQLLSGDQGQEFRKLIADTGPQGNQIWTQLEAIGDASLFNRVFGVPLDKPDPRVGAAGADFLCISAWAKAMEKLGAAILEVRMLLKQDIAPADKRFDDLRDKLRDRMAQVVSHSGEHFGEPLGLVTIFIASGATAKARAILTGTSIQPLTFPADFSTRSDQATA